VVAFALPDSGADVLKQTTARTLRTVGILLILFLASVLVLKFARKNLGLVPAAGNPRRDRDLVGMAGKPSYAGDRACVVRRCRDRVAVNPWAQSQVEEVAGMRLQRRFLLRPSS
jgi:hypothetical protein